MHIMLKNTELLKHSKITLQHVSVYVETIFRDFRSVSHIFEGPVGFVLVEIGGIPVKVRYAVLLYEHFYFLFQ